MKERPILFSAPMVRAILEGRKTQTRRPIHPQPVSHDAAESGDVVFFGGVLNRVSESRGRNKAAMGLLNAKTLHCPYGVPGDRLWVRETWGYENEFYSPYEHESGRIIYRADGDSPPGCNGHNWRPSIHMPRWACRIMLKVEAVRVERLQEITLSDCAAEGAGPTHKADGVFDSTETFRKLWNGVYRNWDANPWVWVVEFQRVVQNFKLRISGEAAEPATIHLKPRGGAA